MGSIFPDDETPIELIKLKEVKEFKAEEFKRLKERFTTIEDKGYHCLCLVFAGGYQDHHVTPDTFSYKNVFFAYFFPLVLVCKGATNYDKIKFREDLSHSIVFMDKEGKELGMCSPEFTSKLYADWLTIQLMITKSSLGDISSNDAKDLLASKMVWHDVIEQKLRAIAGPVMIRDVKFSGIYADRAAAEAGSDSPIHGAQ